VNDAIIYPFDLNKIFAHYALFIKTSVMSSPSYNSKNNLNLRINVKSESAENMNTPSLVFRRLFQHEEYTIQEKVEVRISIVPKLQKSFILAHQSINS
jgi:hypothetical protein